MNNTNIGTKINGDFWVIKNSSHVYERNITGFKVFLVRTYWELVICLLINLPLWIAYGTNISLRCLEESQVLERKLIIKHPIQ